jgi:hypothetical protein
MEQLKLVVKRDPTKGDLAFQMYVHNDEERAEAMPIFRAARDGLRQQGYTASVLIETPSIREV